MTFTLATKLSAIAERYGEPGQANPIYDNLDAIGPDLIDERLAGQDWGEELERVLRTSEDATIGDLRAALLASRPWADTVRYRFATDATNLRSIVELEADGIVIADAASYIAEFCAIEDVEQWADANDIVLAGAVAVESDAGATVFVADGHGSTVDILAA